MKRLALALLVLIPACSSAADSQPESLADRIGWINECQSQATAAADLYVVGREWPSFQEQVGARGADDLDRDYRHVYEVLTIGKTVGALHYFDERVTEAYEPGQTQWRELLDNVGLAVATRMSRAAGEPWRKEISEIDFRVGPSAERECEAQRPDAIAAMCANGTDSACVAMELYPERDLEKVAEACELVPYLIFCDPEDPPPFLPPES